MNAAQVVRAIPDMSIRDCVNALARFRSSDLACAGLADALSSAMYRNAAARREVASHGGAEALVEAMRSHGSNAAVQRNTAEALANFTCEDSANQAAAGELGAVELLTAMLRKFRRDDALLEAGCTALQHLCAHHAENQQRAKEANAMQALANVLRSQQENEEVVAAACLAVRDLTFGHVGNQDAAEESDAIQGLLGAVVTHKENEYLQDAAFGALQYVAFAHAGNRERAASLGVLEMAVEVMNRCADNPYVQENTAAVLWNVVGDSAAYRERAVQAGAVGALERALQTFTMTDRGWQKGAAMIEGVTDNVNGALAALGTEEAPLAARHSVQAKQDAQIADDLVANIRKNWSDRVSKARSRNAASGSARFAAGVRAFATASGPGCRDNQAFRGLGQPIAWPLLQVPAASPPRFPIAGAASRYRLLLRGLRAFVR
eukprot:TRINITY_DN29395_c0_g2_i2.p1 TRINITY_DN29395_c0_g2~~TRINITY_DN29395_c0_g2_i2.p1  ORF type:complete len:464 (-),score=100.85 TRINITY_DN29395_c0_g2_i2:194-1495(-)